MSNSAPAPAVASAPTPPSGKATVGGDVLVALSAAAHAREILRFDYAERGTRRVEPHHVVTRDGRWYLVGWDLDRQDWRTFRADRITLRTPNGPRFTPRLVPGGDVAAYVTSTFHGNTCRGMVILDLPATTVAQYTPDGAVEELGPDRCRLTLESWSWMSLAASVARFDADVQVIDPPELRAACTRLAQRFLNVAP